MWICGRHPNEVRDEVFCDSRLGIGFQEECLCHVINISSVSFFFKEFPVVEKKKQSVHSYGPQIPMMGMMPPIGEARLCVARGLQGPVIFFDSLTFSRQTDVI